MMLEVKSLFKIFKNDDKATIILNNISLKFSENEFVCILSPSGSGKTTLINILSALQKPDGGKIFIFGKDLYSLSEDELDFYRNQIIAIVFQDYKLIPYLSVQENILLPLKFKKINKNQLQHRLNIFLDLFALHQIKDSPPNYLSGGEQQKVALARALIKNPKIIFADEPTGALNKDESENIMKILKSSNRLIIMATHNRELAQKYATRIIELKNGKIVNEKIN